MRRPYKGRRWGAGFLVCALALPLFIYALDEAPKAGFHVKASSKDALILVDGRFAGVGEVARSLPAGDYRVSALAPAGKASPLTVTLIAGETMSQHLRLRAREEPEWVRSMPSRLIKNEQGMTATGVGMSLSWGMENQHVQLLVADLRARMEVARLLESQCQGYSKSYASQTGPSAMSVGRSVTGFSWDRKAVARGLAVTERWMDQSGLLYSKASLVIKPRMMKATEKPDPCKGRDTLVLFETGYQGKGTTHEAVMIKDAGKQPDLEDEENRKQGKAWTATQKMPVPERPLCIAIIASHAEPGAKSSAYIENISLFTYPEMVPVGNLIKDFAKQEGRE